MYIYIYISIFSLHPCFHNGWKTQSDHIMWNKSWNWIAYLVIKKCWYYQWPNNRVSLLRWDPPLRPEGLEEGEEAEADGRVFSSGRLVCWNWTQPAEVSGVQGDPQQEGGGARTFPRLLPLLLFQTVKLANLTLTTFTPIKYTYIHPSDPVGP